MSAAYSYEKAKLVKQRKQSYRYSSDFVYIPMIYEETGACTVTAQAILRRIAQL